MSLLNFPITCYSVLSRGQHIVSYTQSCIFSPHYLLHSHSPSTSLNRERHFTGLCHQPALPSKTLQPAALLPHFELLLVRHNQKATKAESPPSAAVTIPSLRHEVHFYFPGREGILSVSQAQAQFLLYLLSIVNHLQRTIRAPIEVTGEYGATDRVQTCTKTRFFIIHADNNYHKNVRAGSNPDVRRAIKTRSSF